VPVPIKMLCSDWFAFFRSLTPRRIMGNTQSIRNNIIVPIYSPKSGCGPQITPCLFTINNWHPNSSVTNVNSGFGTLGIF
jgi:hypothetical protein